MAVIEKAPAKINLTLEVLGKRDDGFHELRSVIQTIGLCDTLSFGYSDDTLYRSEDPDWEGNKSLVSKVVDLFRETIGVTKGVSVTVGKNIPMMAGLGGDSSDAAAVLRGLNRLWETGLSTDALHAMAEKLGSDVPFFLYGGTALLEGRGEKVIPLPEAVTMNLVLVIPGIPVLPGKTGKLFSVLKPGYYTGGEITRNYAESIKKGGELPEIYNVFEEVAYTVFPGLEDIRQKFEKIAGNPVHLAGAGPVLFTLTDNGTSAETLCEDLKKQGLSAVCTETVAPM